MAKHELPSFPKLLMYGVLLGLAQGVLLVFVIPGTDTDPYMFVIIPTNPY